MTSILICDDHAVVRRGLRDILHEQYPDAEFGEAKTGDEALQAMQQNDWSIVILDIMMPGKDGIEVLNIVKKDRPDTKILILSSHPEEQFAVRVLKLGASGYMNKESASDELRNAVQQILDNKTYLSPKLADRVSVENSGIIAKEGHELLSEREFFVIQRICNGKSIKEIAGELDVSAKTITTYRTRAMKKLDLKSNAEIVQYALRNGLIT